MNLFNLVARVSLDDKDYNKGIDNVVGGGRKAESSFSKIGGSVLGMAKVAGTAMLAAGAAVGGLGMKYNSEMEQYTAAFETMLGGADAASKHLDQLKAFAAKTPFELGDLAQASKTLLAFGTDVEDIEPSLKMLGDISLGNKDKFNSLSLVFGQVASQGKLMGGDLLQMINAGFNPLLEISKKTGKSMEQLKDEMSKGQISFEMVEDAMKSATSEGGQFNNAMEKQSKTLSGLFSTLKDNFNALSGKIMKPVFDLVKKGIETLLPMLESFSAGFDKVAEAFGGFGKSLSEFDDPMVALGDVFMNLFGVEMPQSVYDMVEGVLSYWNTLWEVVKDVFDTVVTPIFNMLKEIFDSTGITAEGVFATIGNYFSAMSEVLKFMWENVGKPVFEAIMSIVGVVKDIFIEYMPMIQNIFSTVMNDLVDIWNNNLKPMFDAIVSYIVDVLVPKWKWVFENVIGPVFGALVRFIDQAWTNGLKPIFIGIIDFITGVFSGSWSGAWNGIVSIFKGIFGGLQAVARAPINAIINMVNKLIGGLNKLSIPDWVPLLGGKGVNIPEIPMLYKGTDYFKGTNAFGNTALVGEQGPELVELPTGSKVNTNKETNQMMNKESVFVINIDGREFMRAVSPYQEEFDNFNSRSPRLA